MKKQKAVRLANATGGFDSSSASEKFSRMEEKIERKEAEAQAFTDIATDTGSNDAEEFEKLENDSKVNSELERLKAEMGL